MKETRRLQVIRTALEELDHPNAEMVFDHVRQVIPRVSLATIYRNLDLLVQEGNVQTWTIGNTKHYDSNAEPHGHLHCTECSSLVDIAFNDQMSSSINEIVNQHSFTLSHSSLELKGMCGNCRGIIM